MKTWLILKHITIENANAISGITYGFPSITHFLGYTHKLDRLLRQEYPDLKLGGCGIISHRANCQTLQNRFREQFFILKRHPLVGHEAKAASEVQEGRIHLDISLVIECCFDDLTLEDAGFDSEGTPARFRSFEHHIRGLAATGRLAGGLITDIGDVYWTSQPKYLLRQLLPGFALVSAHQEFLDQIAVNEEQGIHQDKLQTLLDCIAIRRKYTRNENGTGKWEIADKPIKGWCVPIAIGNRAISDVYDPGVIKATRDNSTSFRFVEPIYSLGKWINPLLAKTPENIIWSYDYQDPYYLCINEFNN